MIGDDDLAVLAQQPVADAFVILTAPAASEALRRTEQMTATVDAEALHQLHLALQRLRILWWAFEPLLDMKAAKAASKRFKQFADIAGKPRNLEMVCDVLARAKKPNASLGSLLRTIDGRRGYASAESWATIRKAELDVTLRRALADARRRLESRAENPSLKEFAQLRVALANADLKKKERRAGRTKHIGYKALHGVEEAASKLKYLLEFFAPVLEADHRAAIEHLAATQEKLGKLSEVVASEEVVRDVATDLHDKAAVHHAVRWLTKQKRCETRAAAELLRYATAHH